jgi:hypothetical protein
VNGKHGAKGIPDPLANRFKPRKQRLQAPTRSARIEGQGHAATERRVGELGVGRRRQTPSCSEGFRSFHKAALAAADMARRLSSALPELSALAPSAAVSDGQ